MQVNRRSVSNKPIRSNLEPSISRVSETMKQAKDVKGGKKLKLRCNKQDKRAIFQKERSDSIKRLHRIKRRLFLEAVKSTPRQHATGKKNRTGQE